MAYQFPAPNGDGDEFLAPNNVLYTYNATDGQWEVIGVVDGILPDPTDDTQQPGTTDDRYVNITGDEMEGPLNVVHPPTEDNHAASKKYVDEKTQGLCWEPLIGGNGVNNEYKWLRASDIDPKNNEVKGNKGGQSSATSITSLTFNPSVDLSEAKVGHNIRLKIGNPELIDEFKITAVNGSTLSVTLVNQGTAGTPYYYLASLEVSYQVECSLFVERTGDKMTGELELEDGFGNIQVFDDTTPEGTAVHKKYVDDSVHDRVARAGDIMTGTLEFSVTGPDATVISIKSTEANQNRIISVDGGTGTSDNLSLLLEGTDGSNNFVIRTTAGDCYSISSNGNQVFSSSVTFTDEVVFDFNSKPSGSLPFQIKGKQGNGGTGANLLKLIRNDSGDQIRYYGGVTITTEIATKRYVDSVLGALDLTNVEFIPVGAIQFWASAVSVPNGWFKLDGSTFDITTYPELHTYLEGTLNYQEGILPDYASRFACHIGNINDGSPGELVAEKSKSPTGLRVDTKTVTFTHNHTATITGTGTHTHTATIGGGSHTHTYSAWNSGQNGGGTGSKNPNSYNANKTASGGDHTHTLTVTGTGSHTHTVSVSTTDAGSNTHSHTVSGGDTTTRPLSVLGYWIIKH